MRLKRESGSKPQRIKWMYMVAGVFIGLFVVMGLWRLVVFDEKAVIWNRGRLNLATEGDTAFMSYSVDEEKITFFTLNPDVQMQLPGGQGNVRYESLSKLSRQNGVGLRLATGSVSMTFGIGIDGWIGGRVLEWKLNENGSVREPTLLQRLKFVASNDSSLRLSDKLKLFFILGKMRSYQVEVLDVMDAGVVFPDTEADGTSVYKASSPHLLAYFGAKLRDNAMNEDGMTVGVSNTTDVPNLAKIVARVLLSSGARVVTEGQSDADGWNGFCRVRGDKKYKDSYLVGKLKVWFNCRFEASGENFGTSDLRVEVGEAFARYITGGK